MKNRYIDYIIEEEFGRLKISCDPFLRKGYIGLCLFLFWYYEYTNDKHYFDLAQFALHNACTSVKKGSKINISDGLCGIGLSLIYLSKKNFIRGDIYDILRNVDDEIYKSVINSIDYKSDFSLHNHEVSLIDVAYYTSIKINRCILPKNELDIQELFLNKIINTIYQGHDYSFYIEPIPYSLGYILVRFLFMISEAYKVKLCQARIEHIWKESRKIILAQFPYLDSNKISLLISINKMEEIFNDDTELMSLAERLKKNISWSRIIEQEFPSNCLSFFSGLSGLYFETEHFLKKEFIDAEFLLSKIKKSYYNKANYIEIENAGFVGFNGILGLIMMYNDLQK